MSAGHCSVGAALALEVAKSVRRRSTFGILPVRRHRIRKDIPPAEFHHCCGHWSQPAGSLKTLTEAHRLGSERLGYLARFRFTNEQLSSTQMAARPVL